MKSSALGLFVGAVLMLASSLSPGAALDEQMHATITVRMQWDKQFERSRDTGSASVRVTGKIKLAEEDGEFLQYAPLGLKATYDFEFKRVGTDPDDECFQRTIMHETGSGGGKPQFDFQAFLGPSGQMQNLQYQATSGGVIDLGRMLQMGSQESFDAYTFMLVLPGMLKTTEKTLCPGPKTRVLPRSILFQMRCKEISQEGLTGSYRWSSSKEWLSSFTPPMEVYYGSCDGTEFYAPEKGDGAVSYAVSWSFGDVKPIVQIWWEEEDITDQEVDVMIGRKVKLKAKVFPEGLAIEKGKWAIDRDLIIAGYRANVSEAQVVPFGKDAFNRPEIEYFFKKGSFGGRKAKVKFSGKVDGKDVEAETTFKIFRPDIDIDRSSLTSHDAVTVGNNASGVCSIYLGSVPANRDGMDIKHKIVMPWLDEDQHLLQYVQRIDEDLLMYNNETYSTQKSEKFCLDTNYPANKLPPHPWQTRFLDSPGPEILAGTIREIHVEDRFETYLMFKPSDDKDDPDAIWVPVELIRWSWATGAICDTEKRFPPCDASTCPPLYTILPDPVQEPWPDHPVWDCNIDNNEPKPVGFSNKPKHKDKWDEELEKRRRKGREGR